MNNSTIKYRFWKTVLTAFPLALVVVLGIKWAYLSHVAASLNFNLPNGTRVVAIGNSHGEDAIDDSILTNWANWCRSGEMNFGTYALLQQLFNMPNRPDTVVLQMMDFTGYDDASINTQYLIYETTRLATADAATLADLWRCNPTAMLSFYCTNDLYTMTQPIKIGGYENWHHHGLARELKNFELRLARDGKRKTLPERPFSAFSLQTRYLSRIIQLCHDNGAAVVLMNYPKANYSRFVDREKVYDYYASLGDSVVVADYEQFAFPDTSCYANMRHLNNKGATIFSQHLQYHGLETTTTQQWRSTAK